MKPQKFEWEGCSSGKIVDRSGEKFVEFFHRGFKVLIPVERRWNALKSYDIEEQMNCIMDPMHFIKALPTMDISPEIKDRFFANFTEPEAMRNRQVAHRGLTAANYSKEAKLIDAVLSYGDQKKGIFEGKRDAIHDPELLMINAHSICEDFCELIEDGNIPALRRIINIVENGIRVPSSQRGGLGSVEGDVLRTWCKLHVESRALPTWGDVRIACGFRQDEETIGRKAFGKFGLAVKTSEQT